MLNTAITTRLDSLRDRFATADPFPHVVIDEFFQQDFARHLLDQFPPFGGGNSLSEFGKPGKKSVNSDFKGIGGVYRDLELLLLSEPFKKLVSDITGLDDLLLVVEAGGTQESLDGADLAPHLDYNFMDWQGEVLHRRLNILFYLNDGWDQAWGGNFELHSNPWEPHSNRVCRYAPTFNRAIIMETSEHSWHGHDLLCLPNPEAQSRKSISVYLFSRVAQQVDLPTRRSTFYAARQLPEQFQVGHTLTEEDMALLQTAVSKRDRWIQHYQAEVLRFSSRAEKFADQARALKHSRKGTS